MADSILLIDDDEGVLRSIGAYFERMGAEVYREGTVKEGLDTFDRVRPDVVVLDLHLPDADGLSALEQLKSKNAAVVLLTGNGDIQTAVRGDAAGGRKLSDQAGGHAAPRGRRRPHFREGSPAAQE